MRRENPVSTVSLVFQDSDPTRWSLIDAAAQGEQEARAVFAQQYLGLVRAHLGYRWRGQSLTTEVEDAAQEVFVELIKPGGGLERADREHGGFRGLLYGVVRNVARRFEERAGSRGRLVCGSVHLDDLPDNAASLSRAFDQAWTRKLLRDAVLTYAVAVRRADRESRRRLRILRLRHQQGLPIRAIAERLQDSDVDRVHQDYRRARREFARHLRDIVARHTGARGEAIDRECRRLAGMLET